MREKEIKKNKKILPRQEVFVEALASGLERADAYALAYPDGADRPREALSRAAYILLNRPAVKEAYERKMERHREEEAEKRRWTYERSVEVRLATLKAIFDDRDRRLQAIETMAMNIVQNPPKNMAPEEVIHEAQKILMQPALGANCANSIASICDSLDKITGLQSENAGEQATGVNIVISNDPRFN